MRQPSCVRDCFKYYKTRACFSVDMVLIFRHVAKLSKGHVICVLLDDPEITAVSKVSVPSALYTSSLILFKFNM